jgi:hypothetical protein
MANRSEPNGRTARDVALPDENRPSWRPQDDAHPHRSRRAASEEDDRFEDNRFRRFDRDRFTHWEDRSSRDWDRDERNRWPQQLAPRDENYRGSFEDRYERDRGLSPNDRFVRHTSGDRDRDREPSPTPRSYDAPDLGTGGGLHGRAAWRDADAQDDGYRSYRNGGHRGQGPSTFVRSDERIRELVCEALTDDDRVDATAVQVMVKNGEVTLTGSVEDRVQKRAAEDCVENVPGVRDVLNQLRISEHH